MFVFLNESVGDGLSHWEMNRFQSQNQIRPFANVLFAHNTLEKRVTHCVNAPGPGYAGWAFG